MNEQFETQNPVENTVTPANQMETPTPEAPKKKGNKNLHHCGRGGSSGCRGRRWRICSGQKQELLSPSKKVLLAGAKTVGVTWEVWERH